jgi:hypothetical protein
MTAIQLMLEVEKMSLRKALRYSGMSSCSYYYRPVARRFEPDRAMVEKVKEVALARPFLRHQEDGGPALEGAPHASEQEEGAEDLPHAELDGAREDEERGDQVCIEGRESIQAVPILADGHDLSLVRQRQVVLPLQRHRHLP